MTTGLGFNKALLAYACFFRTLKITFKFLRGDLLIFGNLSEKDYCRLYQMKN